MEKRRGPAGEICVLNLLLPAITTFEHKDQGWIPLLESSPLCLLRFLQKPSRGRYGKKRSAACATSNQALKNDTLRGVTHATLATLWIFLNPSSCEAPLRNGQGDKVGAIPCRRAEEAGRSW